MTDRKKTLHFKIRALAVVVLCTIASGVAGAEELDDAALLQSIKKEFGAETGIATGHSGSLRGDRLSNFDGETVELSDTDGSFALVSFGATWCPPCREEFPALHRLHARFEGDPFFKVLMVFVGEKPSTVQEYLAQTQLEFPMALDLRAAVANMNNIYSIPTSYLIDPKGNIIAKYIGPLEWDREDVVDAITAMMLRWQEHNKPS